MEQIRLLTWLLQHDWLKNKKRDPSKLQTRKSLYTGGVLQPWQIRDSFYYVFNIYTAPSHMQYMLELSFSFLPLICLLHFVSICIYWSKTTFTMQIYDISTLVFYVHMHICVSYAYQYLQISYGLFTCGCLYTVTRPIVKPPHRHLKVKLQ